MSERRFRRTPGGVCSLGPHLVWCPKYRRRILGGRVAARCDELLEQITAEIGWEIVATEVMPDHVHLFVRVGPIDAPASVVRAFKGRTARVLRAEFPYLRNRAKVLWSPSYFAASVGYVSESTVRRYIEHQWDAVA
jgi:putative transposase